MIKEFVTYEQALALKELGFDEDCFSDYFSFNNVNQTLEDDIQLILNEESIDNYCEENDLYPFHICSVPLYQQAFDFFEEKYFLSGEIQKQAPYQKVTKPYWWYMIQDEKGEDLSDWQSRFNAILDKAHQNIKGNFVDDDKFAKFLYDDKFAFETRAKAKLECLKKLISIVKQ